MTELPSQCSVIVSVDIIIQLKLLVVWSLHTSEFEVIDKCCLLTCLGDRGGKTFSPGSAIQEITIRSEVHDLIWTSTGGPN